MASFRNVRTAPFGHPPSGRTGHENEPLNPGRYQFGPKSTTEYQSGAISSNFDPWTFVWWDSLFATTDDSGGVPDIPDFNPGPEDEDPQPDPDAPWFLNRHNDWQSGPPVNNTVQDNALPKAGYWTNKTGPNRNDSKNDGGFQMLTSSDRPVMLYNMGHENIASQGGSSETNVIGWDGYLEFDKQGTGSKTDCNIGVPHAYAMYTLDISPEKLQSIAQKIADWIEGHQDGGSYSTGDDPEAIHVDAVLSNLEGTTRGIPLNIVIRILKMIVKIIEKMNSAGAIPGGILVNWDFIAELKYPTKANTYIRPPGHTVQNPGNDMLLYSHGNGGPHGKFRFSYTIDPDITIVLALLKMRANGILWHLSSAKGGLRIRIMRTTNFAHIHGLKPWLDIDAERNSKYKQVLTYWHKDNDPDPWGDKTRKLDTRGTPQ